MHGYMHSALETMSKLKTTAQGLQIYAHSFFIGGVAPYPKPEFSMDSIHSIHRIDRFLKTIHSIVIAEMRK